MVAENKKENVDPVLITVKEQERPQKLADIETADVEYEHDKSKDALADTVSQGTSSQSSHSKDIGSVSLNSNHINGKMPRLSQQEFQCGCSARRHQKAIVKEKDQELQELFRSVSCTDELENAQITMRVRSRERSLVEVIKLVATWRRLQDGVIECNNIGKK